MYWLIVKCLSSSSKHTMYTQDGKKYNNTGKNIDTCIKFSAHDMFLENLP